MRKSLFLLMFVLGTALIQGQSYEKFYFNQKLNNLRQKEDTNGYIKLNYTDSIIVVSLHEDDEIYIDCELNKLYEVHETEEYLRVETGLKWMKTYHGKTPKDENIVMIQWSNTDSTSNGDKYAYTFIIDGVETLYLCTERYVKVLSSDVLKFYKLKEW